MDKLHVMHEFINSMWKYMKACEQREPKDEAFWDWAQGEAEKLSKEYGSMGFVDDWIVSFLKHLEEEETRKGMQRQ